MKHIAKQQKNKKKIDLSIVAIIVLAVLSIIWVSFLGKKAEETVKVVMLKTSVYKNEMITEDMVMPYDMLRGEYDKYAIVTKDGKRKRRVVLWSERNKLVNLFAAYPLKANTYAEYTDFVKTRVSNENSVLYSFPDKSLVRLDIGSDLQAFKSYIMPGDRITITGTYIEKTKMGSNDIMSVGTSEEQFKTETVFKDIMIADILNASGESVLDIYASYRDKTVYQQAKLDASQAFKDSVKPNCIIIALTEDELERYYYYLTKSDITFRASLPQRG